MARYYADEQKAEIGRWLLELREIATPKCFEANRNRARELVARLDQCNVHSASLIAYEYDRMRRIWRRLEEST